MAITEDQWGPWEVCEFCGVTSHHVQIVPLPGGKIVRRIGPRKISQSDVAEFAEKYNEALRMGYIPPAH